MHEGRLFRPQTPWSLPQGLRGPTSRAPPPKSPTAHARPHNARAASRSLGPQLHDAFLVFQWVPEGHAGDQVGSSWQRETSWTSETAPQSGRPPGATGTAVAVATAARHRAPEPGGPCSPRGRSEGGGGEVEAKPPTPRQDARLSGQAQRCSATKAQIRHNLALWRPCLQHLFPPGHTDSAV